MSGLQVPLIPRNTMQLMPIPAGLNIKLALLNWWKIPRRAWVIILSELSVILFLSSWVYLEYLNSPYFQSYVNSLAPIILPIFSVAFGVTSATVATYLYFGMRRVQQSEHTGDVPRRRLHRKGRKTHSSTSKSDQNTTVGVPRPRFVITSPGQTREPSGKNSLEKKEK